MVRAVLLAPMVASGFGEALMPLCSLPTGMVATTDRPARSTIKTVLSKLLVTHAHLPAASTTTP